MAEIPTAVALLLAPSPSPLQPAFDPYWAPLLGKPTLAWSLAALLQTPAIGPITLVAPPERLEAARQLGEALQTGPRLTILPVAPGLAPAILSSLDASPNHRWLLVQDGAHPRTFPELFTQAIARLTAQESGGSAICVALPVKDTIKRATEGVARETLDRSQLALLQTPLVLPLSMAAALSGALQSGATSASVIAAAHTAGLRLLTIPGRSDDLAVRSPDDLAVAAALLTR